MLVEDHSVVRNGIKLLLNSQENFEVVADVGNGKEALDLLYAGLDCDAILTDLNMEVMDGLQLIEEVSLKFPEIKKIVLTMLNCDQHVARAFESGVDGYLVKNVATDEMIFSINHIVAGGKYICEEISLVFVKKLIEKNKAINQEEGKMDIDLSSRELEVLELLGEGYTNLEISKKLFLSKRTVEGHRQNLIDKTGSKNTPALIKFAVLNGLIK